MVATRRSNDKQSAKLKVILTYYTTTYSTDRQTDKPPKIDLDPSITALLIFLCIISFRGVLVVQPEYSIIQLLCIISISLLQYLAKYHANSIHVTATAINYTMYNNGYSRLLYIIMQQLEYVDVEIIIILVLFIIIFITLLHVEVTMY